MDGTGTEPATAGRAWVTGNFEIGTDLERTGRDGDAHLEQYLRLEAQPPEHPKLTLRGALWMIEDLDGDERHNSTLRGITDASGSPVQARLLYLYLERDGLWGDATLRLGRLAVLENPAAPRVDGALFQRRLARWEVYAFGGVRASLYEDAHNELAFGGGVAVDLGKRTRIYLDTFYGENERDGSDHVRRSPAYDILRWGVPRRVTRFVDSRLVAVTVSHRITPRHNVYARYTWADGSSDEARVTVSGVVSGREIAYEVTYRRRLHLITDRADAVTAYYRILGAQDEFDDAAATIHFPLSSEWTLSLLAQVHEARTDAAESANRDFERFAATFSGVNLGRGINASASVERWNVEGAEGSWVVTGGIERTWHRFTLTLGADFTRYEDRVVDYRPDYLWANQLVTALLPGTGSSYRPLPDWLELEVVETHENIHSLYAGAAIRFSGRRTFDARLTFEEDDGPDAPYWRFRAWYTIRF